MAGKTANLYLQISANLDTFTQALKQGKVSMAQFAGDIESQIDAIGKAFETPVGGNIATTARQMETAFRSSFANIRAAAEEALTLPKTDAGAVSINLVGAQQALAQAENLAAAYHELADAAAGLVIGNDAATDAEKRNALAAAAGAEAQDAKVAGIREEVVALTRLQGALDANGISSVEAAADNDLVVGSHARMGASGLIAEHVVRSFSDSITAGQSPVRAFALELPRITEAMQFMAFEAGNATGFMGKFASFMGGPWGLAITLGSAVLAPLITGLLEANSATDDAVAKLREHARQSSADAGAQDIFAKSAEGVAEAILDQNKALSKNIDSQTTMTASELAAARTALAHELQIRRTTIALLEQAKAQQEAVDAAATGSNQEGSGAAVVIAGSRVADLQSQIDAQNKSISTGQENIRLAEIHAAEMAAKAAVDPLAAINQQYDRMADAAKDAAKGNDQLAASLAATLTRIEQQRKAATDAEQASARAARQIANDDKQVGRSITLDQAEAIVTSIGGTITSSYRTLAQQQKLYAAYQAGTGSLAAKPGTSLHERGQALDVAKTAGISLGSLKKAFADAGVHLTEALDEGNHYHVGFGKKGPSQDTLDRRQQSQVVHAATDDRAYQAELGQAQDAYARAQLALSDTAQSRLKVETDELQAGLQQKLLEIDDQVTAKKINSTEADKLKQLAISTEALEEEAAKRKKLISLVDTALQHDQTQLQGQIDLLNLQESLATTTAQRRDIALKLLALDEASARAQAEADLDRATISGDKDKQADARARLGQIDDQHGLRVQQVNQQNAGPLAAYALQLHQNTDDMNAALQDVEVDGLKGLEDGLTGLISGTESVSDAFKKMAQSIIADLAKIAIEKALAGFIGSIFGGAFGGTTSAGTGAVYGGDLGGIYADGGHVKGPGTGRSDSILARLSNGEFVMNADATAKYLPLLHALNDNSMPGFADGGLVGIGSIPSMRDISPTEMRDIAARPAVEQHFHLQGNLVTEKVYSDLMGFATAQANKAVQVSTTHTNKTVAGLQRKRL